MSLAPQEYIVEILEETPAEAVESVGSGFNVEVLHGHTLMVGEPVTQPEIIEVFSAPPTGGGYDRVEVLAFTKQGPLSVITLGASEFPIAGGTFLLESVAARVVDPPTGSSVILDVLRNNVSIFANPAHRPTISAGLNNAAVTIPAGTMFADGDYLEIHIVSVGSTTPGSTLTASVRLARVG